MPGMRIGRSGEIRLDRATVTDEDDGTIGGVGTPRISREQDHDYGALYRQRGGVVVKGRAMV